MNTREMTAEQLAQDVMRPRTKGERRFGVDLDVAAIRVTFSWASAEVRQEALTLLAEAGHKALKGAG